MIRHSIFLPITAAIALIVIFGSCTEPAEDSPKILPHETEADNTLSTDFNSNTFTEGVEAELLKELKICNPNATSDTNELDAGCSPKFFRFFKLTKKMPLKNGFILLVKAGVNGFPLRRILVFEREKGQLIKLNGFNGNLIETRTSPTGYDDLIIRFPDRNGADLIYYNCLFQWKNGLYEYQYCEDIDENGPHRVKAEFRDSMGVEIKKILDRNNMLF